MGLNNMTSFGNGILNGFRFEYDRCSPDERINLTVSWLGWLRHPYSAWSEIEVLHAKKVLSHLLQLITH